MRARSPSAEDRTRRVAGWQAAAERERQTRAADEPLSPDEALAIAEELWSLKPGAFAAVHAVREREVEGARRARAKLRERLAWTKPRTGPV